MGTGASAGLRASLQAASQNDLNTVLSGIPSDTLQRLCSALSEGGGGGGTSVETADVPMFETHCHSKDLSRRWSTRCSISCVAGLDAGRGSTVEIPDPSEIMSQFNTVDLKEQPYAESMLMMVRDPKSDAEKVFRSRYTATLLSDAALEAEAILGEGSMAIKAYHTIPPLTMTIVYDVARWHEEVVPQYQAVVDSLDGAPNSPEIEQFLGMLLKVKDMFYWEMQNPKQDFYMCLLDEMHVEYSRGELRTTSVSQESLRMMHSIDMDMHIRRSDLRRDIIAAFYTRLYEGGVAGNREWDLQVVLAEHGDKTEIKAIASETPLLAFELDEREPTFPGYVLMEGSGRLAALNAALDIVRAKHPDFIAPLISLSVLPFYGNALARQNMSFLLDLTWRGTFPAMDVPGYRCQVSNSVRKVSEDLAEKVLTRPRYFGFHPTAWPSQCMTTGAAGG